MRSGDGGRAVAVAAVEVELAQLWRKYAHAARLASVASCAADDHGHPGPSSTCSSSSAACAHAAVADGAGGSDSDSDKINFDADACDTGFDVLWPQEARMCWWGRATEPIMLTLPPAESAAAVLPPRLCVGVMSK